jgi:hypothetical protein
VSPEAIAHLPRPVRWIIRLGDVMNAIVLPLMFLFAVGPTTAPDNCRSAPSLPNQSAYRCV